METRQSRMRITEVNPHLLCALCGGYLIDATTIVECLHSFCKTCILRYLETSNYCPICEVLIHKTRPWQNIRLDHTLQNIVYKLVPGLFRNEMKWRREFYNNRPSMEEKRRCGLDDGCRTTDRVIFSADEEFSVALEFCPNGQPEKETQAYNNTLQDRRYLLCPAGVTVSHVKKFIRLKYSLSDRIQIDLLHTNEPLRDHYTLMDVAYIISWKRQGILKLYYSFYENSAKKVKLSKTEGVAKQEEQTDDKDKQNKDAEVATRDSKEIVPNGVAEHASPSQSTECLPAETEAPLQLSACAKTDDVTESAVTGENAPKSDTKCSETETEKGADNDNTKPGLCSAEATTPEREVADLIRNNSLMGTNGLARSSQSSDSATEYESSPGTDCRRLNEPEHVTPLKWHSHSHLLMNGHCKAPGDLSPEDIKSDTCVMPLDYSQPS